MDTGRFEWDFNNLKLTLNDQWPVIETSLVKWLSDECDWILSIISQVQLMAWCQRATSNYLANVDPDLCCHMSSLGHNELNSRHAHFYFISECCSVLISTSTFLAVLDTSFSLRLWITLKNQNMHLSTLRASYSTTWKALLPPTASLQINGPEWITQVRVIDSSHTIL